MKTLMYIIHVIAVEMDPLFAVVGKCTILLCTLYLGWHVGVYILRKFEKEERYKDE